ncbi:MAG: UbiA family prenyltransferase [bacterium]
MAFLRGFLEGVLEESHLLGFQLEPAQSAEMLFLHGPLFYLTVFTLAAVVLSSLARAPIEKTARAALAFSPIILVAPVVDGLLSPQGMRLHYFSDVAATGRGLLLTFWPGASVAGVSPGMRVEVLLACLAGALYARAKRGGFVRPVAGFVGVYLVAALAGSLPALLTLAVRGNVAESTLFTSGGLVFSETSKYALVQLPVAAVGMWLCYARYRRGDLLRVLPVRRPLRALFYVFVTAFGLILGAASLRQYYAGFLVDPFVYLAGFATLAAVLFLFQFQVIVNDYFDREIDRVSGKRTYFSHGDFGASEIAFIGLVTLILSLVCAAAAGYAALLILLAAHLVGLAYSVPPLRLKRFFILNTLALAFGVLLVACLGFALFAGRHSLSAFPRGVAGAMIVGFTVALGIKDVGDYEGDRQGGVRTVMTVLGPRCGKRLLAAAMLVMYVAVPFLARYPLLALVCIPCGVASALGVLGRIGDQGSQVGQRGQRWGERAIFIAFYVFAATIMILVWTGRILVSGVTGT